jgi:prevent-host-death family protein
LFDVTEIDIHEAMHNLSKLIDRAEGGEEIMITRRGEPAARLISERQGGGFASLAGAWRDRVQLAEDFDELPQGASN